jgi:hypothetical protein
MARKPARALRRPRWPPARRSGSPRALGAVSIKVRITAVRKLAMDARRQRGASDGHFHPHGL